MRRITLRIALFICSLRTLSLHADSYGPFHNFRQADPTGRYYVVIERAPGWPGLPGYAGPVGM